MQEFIEAVQAARQSGRRVFVVLHLFAGLCRDFDVAYYLRLLAAAHGLELLLLCADLATDWRWDLSLPATFAALASLAEQGYIDILIGGPPCSTWSRARFNKSILGPRPLRFRGAQSWGR